MHRRGGGHRPGARSPRPGSLRRSEDAQVIRSVTLFAETVGVRIIAGSREGHRIDAPKGDATRPTSDRVRESAFNLIGPVDGAAVLDLFAGSGAMGLEALSRGAASCVFVESEPRGLPHDRREPRQAPPRTRRVLCQDAPRALAAERGTYDLVLCDPPYDDAPHAPARAAPRAHPRPGRPARLRDRAPRSSPRSTGLAVRTSRRYGSARLTLFEP